VGSSPIVSSHKSAGQELESPAGRSRVGGSGREEAARVPATSRSRAWTMAPSRSAVACWYIKAARGEKWPIRAMSSSLGTAGLVPAGRHDHPLPSSPDGRGAPAANPRRAHVGPRRRRRARVVRALRLGGACDRATATGTVIISHRFSTVRLGDVLVVVEEDASGSTGATTSGPRRAVQSSTPFQARAYR
jgi:hypothetical protein